jgi:site-specific DNA recombinase
MLARHRIKVLSMADGYLDEESDAGYWIRGIKEIKAEADSREIGRRAKRGLIAQVKRGFWPGGQAPFGYRRKPVFSEKEKDIDGNPKRLGVTLEIKPAEAEIVRKVFHLFADRGMGLRNICNWLNKRGCRNRKGQTFYSSFIGALLRNEVYAGDLVYNKTKEVKHPDGRRTKLPNPPEEWVIRKDVVPVIISRETWEKAQQRIKDKQAVGRGFQGVSTRGVLRPQRITLLSGLIKCAVCGKNYIMEVSNRTYRYYGCSARRSRGDCFCHNRSRIRADELHGLVLDAIGSRLLREEAIQYLEQRMKEFLEEFIDTSDEERQRLLEQRGKANTSIGRYVRAIEDEGIDLRELHEKLNQLKAERNRVDSRLRQIDLLTRERDKILSERLLQSRALAAKERIKTIEDKALLHEELRKHIEWIKVYPNGKVVMRGKRTGLLDDSLLNLTIAA